MRCSYCNYETGSLTADDSEKDLEGHVAIEHPLQAIWLPNIGAVLEMHLKYGVAIDDLLAKIREIRMKLSEENKKDYQGLL